MVDIGIIGIGMMGHAFCRYLIRKRLKFVVIEKNKDRIPVMNTDHILYVAGEATVEDNLRKAGIKRASNLIATLGTDADNVLLVLLANGEMLFNPSASTTFGAGEKIIAVGSSDSLTKLEKDLTVLKRNKLIIRQVQKLGLNKLLKIFLKSFYPEHDFFS